MSFDAAPILHERQEHDSMLCAQHALNGLVQDSTFSADQLAEIGKRLDELEAQQLDVGTSSKTSHNLDDTGFFSVGVLEEALKSYNLRLVRWDSEELRPMHDFPEELPAFVFNLEQHWFTIRRFADNGNFFFNLNSFLPKPERVSNMYLGMQLQQAQQEGYSVFAVVSDTIDGGLPDSEADRYFRKNSHLAYASHGTSSNGNAVAGSSRRRPSDFDDEMEIEGRAAQRRRTSDDEADDVREATNGMAETGLYDEEEMMKRAMEESLREMVRQPERPRPTKWRPKEDAPKPNGVAPKASTSAKPVVATEADEDDSPTVEELRRRRLARFGG